MKLVITGASGFLGWHLGCAARAERDWELVPVGRAEFAHPSLLAQALVGADAVVHAAGVNRGDPAEVEQRNIELATALSSACKEAGATPHLLFANSLHAGTDTPYGRGKAGACSVLQRWADDTGGVFANVVLPNLFGEHGRPDYNSFVATFCRDLAIGAEPTVIEDRELELLHAQRASDVFLGLIDSRAAGEHHPHGRTTSVSDVLERLRDMLAQYTGGVVPDLTDDFQLDLFNTLRSYLFPARYPVRLETRADERGELIEIAKAENPGQTFFSTTMPTRERGHHFHRRKVERFVVVQGEATIRLRRLGEEKVIELEVSGASPSYVDIPTMHTHSITNTGASALLTMFWSNEIFDPTRPDTYAEAVGP